MQKEGGFQMKSNSVNKSFEKFEQEKKFHVTEK